MDKNNFSQWLTKIMAKKITFYKRTQKKIYKECAKKSNKKQIEIKKTTMKSKQ